MVIGFLPQPTIQGFMDGKVQMCARNPLKGFNLLGEESAR